MKMKCDFIAMYFDVCFECICAYYVGKFIRQQSKQHISASTKENKKIIHNENTDGHEFILNSSKLKAFAITTVHFSLKILQNIIMIYLKKIVTHMEGSLAS